VPTVFDVIAVPGRRRLLDLLQSGPASVGELFTAAGMSQSNTSKHLRVLREAGLVSSRPAGQQRVYELRIEGFTELARWLTPYVVLRQRALDDPTRSRLPLGSTSANSRMP
jgi:DNA-binding transcriptional ArsR family regulator